MRQIGSVTTQDDASRLADYLLTQGVEVKAERDAGGWVIWVRDENQLDRARQELDHFEKNPADERYRAVGENAEKIRREEQARRDQARRNMHSMGDRWSRPAFQRRPLTVVLIALSMFVTFASNWGNNIPIVGNLTFAEMRENPNGSPEDTGYRAIRQGQLWRVVTPIFVHFDLIHIACNSYWMFMLGGVIEERRGTTRFGLLVLLLAVVSNVAQYQFTHNPNFGGLSGVVFGLFGYVWMKSLFDPKAGFRLDSSTVAMMLIWLVICTTGAVGPIANAAHVAGLVMGIVVGYLPIILRGAKQ